MGILNPRLKMRMQIGEWSHVSRGRVCNECRLLHVGISAIAMSRSSEFQFSSPMLSNTSTSYPQRSASSITARFSGIPLQRWHSGSRSKMFNRSSPYGESAYRFQISAMDAAQEFDVESVKLAELNQKLRLGLVGFGNFGQFLAKRFVKQGHDVLAYSRSDYSAVARDLHVTYFRDVEDFCEAHPDVVVLCTSMSSTEAVLHALPTQLLKQNTLFVDVLSVKEFPRNLLLQVLPAQFDVLCTHPMFGPESGRGSWAGLPFMFEKVRIRKGLSLERCSKFLNVFEMEGCRMVEMSCEQHDRITAGTQFLTHTCGRVLGGLGLKLTPIDSKGYQHTLKLIDYTSSDTFELYSGLFIFNESAPAELERIEQVWKENKSALHDARERFKKQQLLKDKFSDISTPNLVPSFPRVVAKLSENVLDNGGMSSG